MIEFRLMEVVCVALELLEVALVLVAAVVLDATTGVGVGLVLVDTAVLVTEPVLVGVVLGATTILGLEALLVVELITTTFVDFVVLLMMLLVAFVLVLVLATLDDDLDELESTQLR